MVSIRLFASFCLLMWSQCITASECVELMRVAREIEFVSASIANAKLESINKRNLHSDLREVHMAIDRYCAGVRSPVSVDALALDYSVGKSTNETANKSSATESVGSLVGTVVQTQSTLWSLSKTIADQTGVNQYLIIKAIYLQNTNCFIRRDIQVRRQDCPLFIPFRNEFSGDPEDARMWFFNVTERGPNEFK